MTDEVIASIYGEQPDFMFEPEPLIAAKIFSFSTSKTLFESAGIRAVPIKAKRPTLIMKDESREAIAPRGVLGESEDLNIDADGYIEDFPKEYQYESLAQYDMNVKEMMDYLATYFYASSDHLVVKVLKNQIAKNVNVKLSEELLKLRTTHGYHNGCLAGQVGRLAAVANISFDRRRLEKYDVAESLFLVINNNLPKLKLPTISETLSSKFMFALLDAEWRSAGIITGPLVTVNAESGSGPFLSNKVIKNNE